ncbi:MAG: molybdopterin-binding protein [Clostridia bacterium]|nr:molybdopterin-binding protein [Clostridia bacterium]
MKTIPTTESEGCILCHDVTRIVRGETKGPAFRKGHIIRAEDIPVLLSMGKDRIYVWEEDPDLLHENDGAEILRELTQGENLSATAPSEGKIDLVAETDGLLLVDSERLRALNGLGEMMVATRKGGFPVRKGDKVAGMRVIPLVIARDKMESARQAAGSEPLVRVVPFPVRRCGVISTGNEVYYGRIEDTFTPVIEEKLAEYGAVVSEQVKLPDDPAQITQTINRMLQDGLDMVIVTGGMSVDPDDRTPLAIRSSEADVVSYGAPVLPGAMFLLAYTGDGRPVVGLPGCVMYSRRTIFDLVLPSLIAGMPVSREQLVGYGEGGLCLQCGECTFPNCAFGR